MHSATGIMVTGSPILVEADGLATICFGARMAALDWPHSIF